jgi:membrane protein implicated in regulation of membrane protease activity
LLAAAGFIVVVGFASAMIFNLTPFENWKLLLAFVSAIGAAIAAIVSARKKTARKTRPETKDTSATAVIR